MSKRINSYRAVAAFVRGFFEAYARGIIDATIEGNDFQKKNDPKQVKQMTLEHYGEVNQYYFDIMFSTLVRLNYPTAEEANERMQKNFAALKEADKTFEPTMLDYLRIACKSPQLYKAMEAEYKRNFTWLLQGKFTTIEEHVRDYTHGVLISLADEPMAIHLLVRIIVKAYAAGMKCASQEGKQPSLHMPTLHGMLLNNVNILLNEAPLKSDTEDPVALFKEACKNQEENINVLFNTLNDAMKELAEE